ncbi:hypothetical protein MsAg5_07830 [Methanosarcinaceae archaeon Ag5]|uniref:DNA-directed RNA polymerase subunit Rpo3 n=1 Tax=Methanolapillus africanus TaxID=3028297 RepID=A0AAE4SDT4_9EURY|nr:hypothetical protein [Methanosarcinaceae archaeon Ag5]
MDIDILELSKDSAKFVLSGTNAAFANGIRRAMIADVPTLAIEYLILNDNTSVLYDEQLGLRLALVPLSTDSDSEYVPQSECTCGGEGCQYCEVTLRLDVEGPKTVYSGDFISADPKVRPADEKVPIVDLKEGQRIMLEAVAHVGYGRDHVRWQAGIACGYKNNPIITGEACKACGNQNFETNGIVYLVDGEARVSDEDLLTCKECGFQKRVSDLDDPSALKITFDETSFVFTMESDGSYSASELILKSADVIKGRAEEFLGILQDL